MLWNSITDGLSGLQYSDIYIAAAIYFVMMTAPLLILGAIFHKSAVAGGVFGFLIAPLLQSFATLVFVFSTAGILLGFIQILSGRCRRD